MEFEATEAFARQLDAKDELARFREDFYRNPGQIYLDGNSLGLLSRQAERATLRVLEEWKTLGVDGWTEARFPWFFLAETLAQQMAPLIGASAEEVIVANSTTVNLHQLLASLYQPDSTRSQILADALVFPSDLYAITSHLKLRGHHPDTHLALVSSRDGYTLQEADIVAAMTDDIQLIVLPAVLYCSGQLLDMAKLTFEAHRRGILIGFDCAHSIGVVPHELSAWDVDFAFWCGYKYLNDGPGGVGGLYLNRRHLGRAPGLAGWFSSRKTTQFDMARTLDAAPDAGALQIGTPHILSLAPLQGSLEIFAEAGLERIRAKSLRLTAYLRALIETELAEWGFRCVTPSEPARRGGHLALAHPEAPRICRALKAQGVIPDFRPPDIVRLAPVALYNSFADCYDAVHRLKAIMERRDYENYASGRSLVA